MRDWITIQGLDLDLSSLHRPTPPTLSTRNLQRQLLLHACPAGTGHMTASVCLLTVHAEPCSATQNKALFNLSRDEATLTILVACTQPLASS